MAKTPARKKASTARSRKLTVKKEVVVDLPLDPKQRKDVKAGAAGRLRR